MTRFGALLLVTTLGCSGSASSAKLLGEDSPAVDGGVGGSFSLAGRGGSDQGGSSNVGEEDAGGGGSEQPQGAPDAGAAGSGQTEDAGNHVGVGGQGGSDQGDAGGNTGGTGGSPGGTGGSNHGGSGQGGTAQGGSNQGGTGGSEPTPCVDGYHCDGLTLTVCDGGEEFVTRCGTLEEGLYCSEVEGCYGECVNGDVRCSGETAEACVDGSWTVTEECAFQCVAGACEGACEPGTATCVGAAVATCGDDYSFGSPAACPADLNATASCSGDGICGKTCLDGYGDCDSNGSCEADLSSITSCGACGITCPTRANATSSCDGSCQFTCNPGFEDCDGDTANGCELGVSTDPLNCGACGKSCYGGSCEAGQCAFDFEVVSTFETESSLASVLEMVLGPTHVYWWTYDQGTNIIRRAPKAGGEFEVLTTFATDAPTTSKDNTLLISNGQLYWATADGIHRMPEVGGTPVRLTTSRASSMAISNGKLYWNDSHIVSASSLCRDIPQQRPEVVQACNSSKVTTFFSLDLATTAVTQWQTVGHEYSPVLGVIGNEIFVTRFHFAGPSVWDFNAAIVTFDAASGAASRLIANDVVIEGQFYGMTSTFGQAVLSASEIVFTADLRPDPMSSTNGLCRTPLNVAQPHLATTLVTTNVATVASPEYLAADATHAYHHEFYSSAPSIDRVSLADGSVESLFGDAGAGSKIAIDEGHVYWSVNIASTQERAILKTAK